MHHNNTNDDDIMTMMEEKNTGVRNKKCFNLAVEEEEEDENWAALKICGRCFPEILLFRHVIIIILLALQPLKEVAMMTLPTDIALYTLVFFEGNWTGCPGCSTVVSFRVHLLVGWITFGAVSRMRPLWTDGDGKRIWLQILDCFFFLAIHLSLCSSRINW